MSKPHRCWALQPGWAGGVYQADGPAPDSGVWLRKANTSPVRAAPTTGGERLSPKVGSTHSATRLLHQEPAFFPPCKPVHSTTCRSALAHGGSQKPGCPSCRSSSSNAPGRPVLTPDQARSPQAQGLPRCGHTHSQPPPTSHSNRPSPQTLSSQRRRSAVCCFRRYPSLQRGRHPMKSMHPVPRPVLEQGLGLQQLQRVMSCTPSPPGSQYSPYKSSWDRHSLPHKHPDNTPERALTMWRRQPSTAPDGSPSK